MIPQDVALRGQLAMIAGDEPRASCFELRGLDAESSAITERAFIRVYGIGRVIRTVAEWSEHVNVFIGCAPRTGYTSGTLADIARVWCLWCDCDTEEAATALRCFRPRPSLVIASGGPGRLQGYWQLREPVSTVAADRANRRIRKALGSDAVCDATRVLRPVGSLNHKYDPPARVRCVHLDPVAHELRGVVGALEDDERYLPKPRVPLGKRRTRGGGALLHLVRNAEEGNRNSALFWAAKRAADDGILDQLRDELAEAAQDAGQPASAVQMTLDSAERGA